MKLSDLDFTTPNNVCLSLRVIAQLVLVGELRLAQLPQIDHKDGGKAELKMEFANGG